MIKSLLCVLLLAVCAFGQAPVVTLEHRNFPGLHEADSAYSALFVASDGKVYAGLDFSGGAAHLVVYDPVKDTVRDLGDMIYATGENGSGSAPQSKIHVKFAEGRDGKIYFATHYAIDFDRARLVGPRSYTGGHWLAYDPRTDAISDLGIGRARNGLITMTMAKPQQRLFSISDPHGHLLAFDIATRQTRDYGRVNNWDSLCRSLAADDEGNVYGTFGEGRIFKYDVKDDRLKDLSLQIPHRPKGINSHGRDYLKSESGWRVVIWDEIDKKIYGIEESSCYLFSFDPKRGAEGEVSLLAQMALDKYVGQRTVPFATLALALGTNRKLYYAAVPEEFDYSGSKSVAASHLLVYDLARKQKTDLGEMRLADGRRVLGCNAAHAAPDGTIYFLGAVEVRPEAGKPLEIAGKVADIPYRLALLIYKPSLSEGKTK
ncbi:MAG: hypothetical protein HY231_06860 [Acidobacteria bacterium]|nr:hypothetical protein [Acidobacteriota bacterium]